MKKLMTIILGALICLPVFAQSNENKDNELTVTGQLRSRAEYRDGALTPHDDKAAAAAFINNRTRISMDYKRDNLSLGFSAQQVGVWGQNPAVDNIAGVSTAQRMMINESWANIKFGDGFFMKLGRQSLIYDDERILGGLDWNVAGRYHDALKLGYEDRQNKLHAIFAFNQNSEKTVGKDYDPTNAQPYKVMTTLWYQYLVNREFNFSILAMNLGFQDKSTKFEQTFGTNLLYKPTTDLQFYGTFYYQTGKTAVTGDKSISAFMWALNATYSIDPEWKVLIASDYLSGDDGKDAGKFKAFNALYGTHHKFYGTMDYFNPTPFTKGLWDKQLGITYKTSPKVTLALNYHHFSTTTDMLVNDKKQRMLGLEWDLQVIWNVMKDVGFTGGYSTFFGNDVLKAVKGGDPSKYQQWAWVSLNINPKILVTKW